ncbi:hypothetical protein AWC38_SpisGene17423 [Stylophora pistillata]|uniref:Uncharacterized protein n=1 Tax=Stylophora pistillata TaxID=50429 RepID=A0A2B4RPE3_STYPI|nr:hypothetical protein AWC38_SpisGene17423 [Stylophora pistillata]
MDDGFDLMPTDQVDDELPCFSLDELWNENELALTLNDESDPPACPQELHSWQKRNKLLHSHYFHVAAPENCQKISVVQRPLPKSTRFIAESNAKVNSGAPLFLGNSQSNRQLGKYSQHAPLPPPTPGAEDFDLTVYSGSAKNTSSSYWNEGLLTPTSRGKMKQCPRPRSPSEDPYNALEVEDWNILPVVAKPGGQIKVSSSKKKTQNETNLSSSLSSTRFDTPFLLGRSCLHRGNVIATEDECTQRCQQSPCSASFFCSKSSER